MEKDFNHYVKVKQRRKRLLTLLIVTILAAGSAAMMQECSQSFDGPYNKDYQPMDGVRSNNAPRS